MKYSRMKNVIAVGGSWIAEQKLIAESNWSEIGSRTRKFIELSI